MAGLYASSYRRLVGVVALAADSRGDAEDCVQEAFVQLLKSWGTVGAYDDPEGWVRKVAFRLLSNRRRSAQSGLRALLRHAPADDTTAAGAGEDAAAVAAALRRLGLGQRQAVVLHYLLGYGVADVADVLGVPVGTVKSRLNRARAALAPLLSEETSHV